MLQIFGVVISSEGDGRQEFGHRVKEGSRALGGVREIWHRGGMSLGMRKKEFLKV